MKAAHDHGGSTPTSVVSNTRRVRSPSLRGYLEIARIDHWIKNVFVFPGIVVALSQDATQLSQSLLILRIVIGLLATCLVASSNYVLNEVIDAAGDMHHPTKFRRAVPSGRISIHWAYVEWIALMIAGISLGMAISSTFAATLFVLWVMGCVYNVPPVRSKDLPYLDVLSEAVNNPLRMLAGWFIVDMKTLPPASLLLSYWMVGCYFMAIKRFAELKCIGNSNKATAYRKSFAFYNEERLLVSIVFYGSTAMLFFGAFIMRYRLELIVAFPLVALVMAVYFSLGFNENSAAQAPEKLTREPMLVAAVITCVVFMALLLWLNIPILHRIFAPMSFRSLPQSYSPVSFGLVYTSDSVEFSRVRVPAQTGKNWLS
jgi:4-hydroxybenzoate polyprenyltransferase